MRSIRKMALLAGVFAAVMAVSLPAVASAARLEYSGGELVPVGTEFSATSTNFTFMTSYGILSCQKVTMPAELIKNGYKEGKAVVVEAESRGVGSAGICFFEGTQSFGLEPKLRGFRLEGPGAGTMSLELNTVYPAGQKCHFERTDAPVTYSAGTNVLTLSSVKMKASPAACGPFYVSGYLSLADSLGKSLILN
jgi:hypothetical protein